MKIVPAILVPTFSEFETQARRLEDIFDLMQIDVMDGLFVKNKSFDEVESINDLNLNINLELHFMAEHPLKELEKWKSVKNIKRAIFHFESKDQPREVIADIWSRGWSAGIAINPETSLSKIKPYLNLVDGVLFMTVHPGRRGAKFLPEMKEKIKNFNAIKQRPLCMVDGGVNVETIAVIKSWGVEIANVGSAISMAADVEEAYKKLYEASFKATYGVVGTGCGIDSTGAGWA